jgi:3',5'-cyclic AMP phosphodiesterase CpdA
MQPNSVLLTRRAALRHLSSGTLLALGLWPGTLRADNEQPTGRFRFIVVNDTHVQSPACGDYLAGVVRQMKQESPEFCLHCGDVTDKGEAVHHDAVHRVFRQLDAPLYPVIGNHDYFTPTDRSGYTKRFPLRLNYYFRHGGWQFIGLDSSQGQRYEKTTVQPATLKWLDDYLPRLNPRRPTVVFTHFPLGANVNYRPFNSEDVLDRFRDFNLQAVFSGHYHGFTERRSGQAILTTNRCCSLKRNNHDGSKEKGYFVCEAERGALSRRFVEYKSSAV